MQKFRILIVFSSSELGGAERSLTRMALTKRGIEFFDVATLDGEGPWSEWCRSQGISPFVLGRRYSSGAHGRIRIRAFFRLIRLIRDNRYNAVYMIGLRVSFWLRIFKPWLRGARLVHGVRWNPDSSSRLDRCFRLIERWAHPLVDGWITNSSATKGTLTEHCNIPGKKISVIYNGIEAPPKNLPPVKERPLEVLTVANLNPRKGHEEFLSIIYKVIQVIPEARFVFVGRDDMDGRLQQIIKEYGLDEVVCCKGFQEDVSLWYKRARLFVLPSLWGEGCPTSILEANGHMLPVIAYAIDGISELIEQGLNGVLVAPYDKNAFADVIIRILSDQGLAEKMGQSGKLRVESFFTLENCVDRHIEYFSALTAI